jgi:hypothetical protein
MESVAQREVAFRPRQIFRKIKLLKFPEFILGYLRRYFFKIAFLIRTNLNSPSMSIIIETLTELAASEG